MLAFLCCSYVQYSSICARVVRRCLKAEAKTAAAKREGSIIKAVKWEGGKPVRIDDVLVN